jgi:hypothetical protein
MSDRPGGGGDGVLACGDPRCAVCWRWPRPGEGRADWLVRLRAHPTPPYVRLMRIAPPLHSQCSPN